MLKIEVDQATLTVMLEPEWHLSRQDFVSLAQLVDPLIIESGDLNGVLVQACKFSGRDSFASFIAHLQFVSGHHKHVKKMALCTDSAFDTLVKKLGAHFVYAEIKVFPYDELSQANKGYVSDKNNLANNHASKKKGFTNFHAEKSS